jgi:hypothetical protein
MLRGLDLGPRRLLVVALLVHVAIGAHAVLVSRQLQGDFLRYYEIATSHGRPYADYQVEYPIGAFGMFRMLALPRGGPGSFGVAMVCTNLVADGVCVLALLWGWGMMAAAYFALALIPVFDLLLNRMDLPSVAAATLAVAAWRQDRLAVAAVAAVIGGAFKLWPLLFLGLLPVPRRERIVAAPIVACAIAGGVIAAVWGWMAGWHGLLEVLTFRGARGWQIESVGGALVHLVSAESPRLESGAWRIGTVSRAISIPMSIVAAPLCLWSVWRGGRTRHVGSGWLAGVSSLIVLSPLLSAQFVGWLVPGAAMAWAEGDRRPALVAALAVLLTAAFFPLWYEAVIRGSTPALVLVVLRNVVLVALAVLAIVTLRRASLVDADV